MKVEVTVLGSPSLISLTVGRMKCCFTSTETVGLLGTGAQDGHLDFHTLLRSNPYGDDELMLCQLSVDILGTSCDQCRSTVQ